MQKFHEEVTLKVNNLYKSYPLNKGKDKKEVLKGISFEIPKGKILALLGTNGAGKTTTVNILSTLIKADSGQVNLCGFDLEKDPEEIKKHISLTGQFAAVDEELTGRENLIFFAGLNGFTKKEAEQRAEDLIETFRLKDHGDQLVSSYSGGLKRRLDIA
uniref:ABC transporter ATP-binding protein n=1 Tax=Histophilus somni TaxID=731 RepID=UPI00201F2EA9